LPSHPGNNANPVREPLFAAGTPSWPRVLWIHAIHAVALVLLFAVILHLSGGGMRHH